MTRTTIPARRWLDHLRESFVETWEGDEVEGVHQVRVAAGRLSIWLRLGGYRVLRDDLRWLRGTASEVRDIDVAISLDASTPMRDWLREERERRRVELERRWRSPRIAGILEAFELLPPLDVDLARRELKSLERKVKKIDKSLRKSPVSLDRMHDLRRALRRWRYALEWLDEPARRVKKVQDSLGDLNDMRLVLTFLDLPHRPVGLDGHRNSVRNGLERRGQEARRNWLDERDKLPWTTS